MDGERYDTIFVQIPAYRDPELVPTLVDLIEKAQAPRRLRVGVCWQHDEGEGAELFSHAGFRVDTGVLGGRLHHRLALRGASVRVFDYAMSESRGCGWARAIAQQAFRDEAYTLQLDSHHRFAPDWDRELIAQLEALRERSLRPVLVAHPPAYEPGQPVPGRCEEGYQIDFVAFGGPGVVATRSTTIMYPPGPPAPIRARFFSGGFAFADGSFVRDVPADPDHYFNTEEITLAVRAYTQGYDLFHPHRHVLWHYYGRPTAPKVWEDQAAALARGETTLDGAKLGMRALADARQALGMEGMPRVVHWMGRRRSLNEYERFAGLSFARRAATAEALCHIEPCDDDLWLDEAAWVARLLPAPRIP